MKSLRKMTLGKAKRLRDLVYQEWDKAWDPHRSENWLEELNQMAATHYEVDSEYIFNTSINSVAKAVKDHNELLDELWEGEVFVELNTNNTVAFVAAQDSFLGCHPPIYFDDKQDDVLAKISSTLVWPGLSEGVSGYANPFIQKAYEGWTLECDDSGQYSVNGPDDLSISFNNFTMRKDHSDFAGNNAVWEFDSFKVSFLNGKTFMSLQGEQDIPIPAPVFGFIIVNSGYSDPEA